MFLSLNLVAAVVSGAGHPSDSSVRTMKMKKDRKKTIRTKKKKNSLQRLSAWVGHLVGSYSLGRLESAPLRVVASFDHRHRCSGCQLGWSPF